MKKSILNYLYAFLHGYLIHVIITGPFSSLHKIYLATFILSISIEAFHAYINRLVK